MTDDMGTQDKPDPVDVTQDFAETCEMPDGSTECVANIGRWLVAEARHQRDQWRAHAEHTAAAEARLTEQLLRLRAGATPGYVHDDRTTIERPGDFIAWFLDLDEAARIEVAERALQHAREAGQCFYEDHNGRIETLEAQVQLYQSAHRAPKSVAERVMDQARERIADVNYPETTERTEHG